MNNLWCIGISKVQRWEADPYSRPTREEADRVMKAIGGKVDNDEGLGCYNVVLPGVLDILMDRHAGSFEINFTMDGEDYRLNAEA